MGIYRVNASEKLLGYFLAGESLFDQFDNPEFGVGKIHPRHQQFLIRKAKVFSVIAHVKMEPFMDFCKLADIRNHQDKKGRFVGKFAIKNISLIQKIRFASIRFSCSEVT